MTADHVAALAELIREDTDEPMLSAIVIAKHILASPAMRDLLAEAWDEGFGDCFDVSTDPVRQNVPNPYRTTLPTRGAAS